MTPRSNVASRQIVNHLITFIAVAETRNFRRAAQLIGRSQPSVTAHISQLEELLGVALLTRTTRQVIPTAAGTTLLLRAKSLVNEAENLVRDFQGRTPLTQSRLSVSVSPTVCARLMPRFLGLFQAEHPNVLVSFREDMGPEMIEALQIGDVEIGVGPYNRVPDPLKFEPLINQPFFLIMRRDHPLARSGHATVTDLEGLDLICPPRGMTARDILDRAAQRQGFNILPKHEAAHFITLAGMVSLGLGMTVMPLSNRRMLEAFDLVALPFVDQEIAREIGVLSRRGEPLTPPAAAFKRLLFLTTGDEGELLEEGWQPLTSRRSA
jgi:LysR family transcriptional regulator, carnitine catabolism transcriptional activator